MVYEYIIHPRTQEKVPIHSEKATKILVTYLQQQKALQQKYKKRSV